MLKIYKEDFTVRSYQTDLNARMKPSAILEVMQEAAGQHSERLGLGRSALLAKNTAWVLTRVEVDMDRYPAFEETFSAASSRVTLFSATAMASKSDAPRRCGCCLTSAHAA